ncbi:putative membrane protein [[Clostridium] cellulosi]|jgi:hypothetical protein|uniref:Putative membrane protein n=1 Tax=[Clostridium] cellulosi TaxID=29343 RepID=A0A078KQW4_9FIRM|nr:putative membrane protein [[Clostridium] cellulosi]
MKNKSLKIISALIAFIAYIVIAIIISETIFKKYNVNSVLQSVIIGIIAGIVVFIYLRITRHFKK